MNIINIHVHLEGGVLECYISYWKHGIKKERRLKIESKLDEKSCYFSLFFTLLLCHWCIINRTQVWCSFLIFSVSAIHFPLCLLFLGVFHQFQILLILNNNYCKYIELIPKSGSLFMIHWIFTTIYIDILKLVSEKGLRKLAGKVIYDHLQTVSFTPQNNKQ